MSEYTFGAFLLDLTWVVANGSVAWAVSASLAERYTHNYWRTWYDGAGWVFGMVAVVLWFVGTYATGGLGAALAEPITPAEAVLAVVITIVGYATVLYALVGVRIIVYRGKRRREVLDDAD